MIRLFCKASRILIIVIVAFFVILALSRFLPFIGSLFNKINNFFNSIFYKIENIANSLVK